MGRKFGVLRERMAAAEPGGIRLGELRQARQLSQEALAEKLGARQASISRLERRADMHVSTLRSYVEAMGGTLEIIARFPDGSVPLGPFGEPAAFQYPVGGGRREPMLLHERPVAAVPPSRARRGPPTAPIVCRRPDSLDDLRALRGPITEIAVRHGATNLRVFGSAVRGGLRSDSDIDLLVRTGKHVGPWFPGGLAAELGELLGRRVDVVTEQALAPELRERVLREAVPL